MSHLPGSSANSRTDYKLNELTTLLHDLSKNPKPLVELWVEQFELAEIRNERLVLNLLIKMLERTIQELPPELKIYRLYGQATLAKLEGNYINSFDLLQQGLDFLTSLVKESFVYISPDLLQALLKIGQGDCLILQDKIEAGEKLIGPHLETVQRYNHRRAEGIALLSIAQASRNQGDLDKTLSYTTQALNFFKEIGDKLKEADAYNSLAYYHITRKNYHEALQLLENVIGIRSALGNRRDLGAAYHALMEVSYNLGQYQKAMEAAHLAINLYRQSNNSSDLARATTNVAICLYEMKQPAKAIEYANQSVEVCRLTKRPFALAIALAVLAKNAAALGDEERAAKAIDEAKSVFAELGEKDNLHSRAVWHSHLGQALLLQAKTEGDYREVLAYVRQSIKDFSTIGYLDNQFKVADQHAKIILEDLTRAKASRASSSIGELLYIWREMLHKEPEEYFVKNLNNLLVYADWLAQGAKLVESYQVYTVVFSKMKEPPSRMEKVERGELLLKVAEIAPESAKKGLLEESLNLLKEGGASHSRQKEVAKLLKRLH